MGLVMRSARFSLTAKTSSKSSPFRASASGRSLVTRVIKK